MYMKYINILGKNNYKKTFSIGGSTALEPKFLNLSGPEKIFYIKNKDKKIILIGDIHQSKNICPVEDVKLENYINDLFEKDSLENFDLFIEFSYNEVKKLGGDVSLIEIGEITDYMTAMRKVSLENYKKNPNKKVHFSDIRDDNLAQTLRNKGEVLEKILQTVTPKDPDFNYKELIMDFHESVLRNLFNDYSAIRNYMSDKTDKFEFSSELLNKELTGLEQIINKENIKKIFMFVRKQIEELFDILYQEEEKVLFGDIPLIQFKFINCITLISELYTLARIFKPEINNIIVFEGVGHIDILVQFLRIVDSDLFYYYQSYQDKPQCVEAIPFDKFFLEL